MLTPLELYKFGMGIKESVDENNERAVIIASGDLSHKLKALISLVLMVKNLIKNF